jgi:tetraprenyl-beta-curcumene synthase
VTGAVLGALAAYVTTVLPRVGRELRRWRKLAEAAPDPERRRQALAVLEEKRSNVEAVAVFATLAPLRRRRAVLRAIVPLQLAIDYRDVLEEAGAAGGAERDGFIAALENGWVREAERLAGYSAIAPLLRTAVERCREGQRQTHAAAAGDSSALRRWASDLDASPAYRWWEVAAGASSSVAAHALIAAAADPASANAETASAIDAAYFPPVGALTVLLDDLVDREADREAGEHNYLAYYASDEDAAERLGRIAARATGELAALPRSNRHRAILDGVGASYLSGGKGPAGAGAIRERLLTELGPGARALAAFVRLRQAASRERPRQPGKTPGPLA